MSRHRVSFFQGMSSAALQRIASPPASTTPSPGPGLCLFVGASGTQSVSVMALSGKAAKNLFLATIAQLQADCTVSFSMQGEATPTPFPPEVQALADRSLAELIDLQDQVQREQCGFIPTPEEYQRLDGLGETSCLV